MNFISKLKKYYIFLIVKDGYIVSVMKFYFKELSICEGDWVEVQKTVNEKIRGAGGGGGLGWGLHDPKSNIS